MEYCCTRLKAGGTQQSGLRAIQAVNTKVRYSTKSKVEGQINHEVKPSAIHV